MVSQVSEEAVLNRIHRMLEGDGFRSALYEPGPSIDWTLMRIGILLNTELRRFRSRQDSYEALYNRITGRVWPAGVGAGPQDPLRAIFPYLDPTTALTLSGNEITDATRLANVDGDGRTPPDYSYGTWEATTNRFINAGFETDVTTGITANSGTDESISRITSDKKFGAACAEIILGGATTFAGYRFSFTSVAGQAYAGSIWIKKVSGASTQLRIRLIDGDGSTLISSVTIVPTTEWVLYRINGTAAISGAVANIQVIQGGGFLAMTFRVDGVQVENQPIQTPTKQTDGAIATRNAARIEAPVGALDETQGWWAVRLRMGWGVTAEPGATSPMVVQWADSNTERLIMYYLESDNSWRMQRQTGGAGAATGAQVSTHAVGDFVTLVAKWTSALVGLSVNGADFVTSANTNIPTLAATSLDIGSQGALVLNRQIDADVMGYADGLGDLDNADAAAIHAKLSSSNRQYLTLGDFPKVPIGWWLPRDGYMVRAA